MTPTATRLAARLDERRAWFHNSWLFKWHQIGGSNSVSIDLFDGRSACIGGIAFNGSTRQLYWEAVVRGVRKEIIAQLAWVEQDVRSYSALTAIQAIEECAGQLTSFSRAVRRDVIAKDRILRGDGSNFPPENDAGHWIGTLDADIQAQANAVKAALLTHPASVPAQESGKLPWRKRASVVWGDNQWWLGPVGLLLAIAGLAPLLF